MTNSDFDSARVASAVSDDIPDTRVIWEESVASTNREIRNVADDGKSAWTVLVAGQQTAGRGRYDRKWLSPEGGLYQSVLLNVQADKSPITLLPLVAGLALRDAVADELARHGGGAFRGWLKWPNDLVTSRGKLAGILCETTQDDGNWEVIIGCGLNFIPAELPPELIDSSTLTATSLAEEYPAVDWRREDVLVAYLLRLKYWLDIWIDRPAVIRQAWMEASGIEGRHVTATVSGKKVEGIARGITQIGALILETEQGRQELNAAEGLIVRAPDR